MTGKSISVASGQTGYTPHSAGADCPNLFAFPFFAISYVLTPWLLFPVPGYNAPA
jgi:hypothetical protein